MEQDDTVLMKGESMTDPNNAPNIPNVPLPAAPNGAASNASNNPNTNAQSPSYPSTYPSYGSAPSYGQAQGQNGDPYAAQNQQYVYAPQYSAPTDPQAPAGQPQYGAPASTTPANPVPPTPSAPYGPAAGGNPYGGQNPYGNQNTYNQAPPSYNQYSQFAAPSAGMTTGTIPLDQPYYGCPFPEAFLRFWKKYVVFTGRASRSEYWWWTLAALGINIVLGIIADVSDDKLAFLTGIWSLAVFIPGLALSVRRLHDINKSGWWLAALYGVMVIGVILMIAGGGAALFGGFLGFSHGDYNNVYGAAAAGGFGIMVIGWLAIMIASIVLLVFMCLPSKPEGARFDAQPGAGNAAFGAPAGQAPAAAAYGQPAAAAPYAAPTSTPNNGYDPNYGSTASAYSQPTAPSPFDAAPTGAPTAPETPAPAYGQQPFSTPAYGQNAAPVSPSATPSVPFGSGTPDASSAPLPEYGQPVPPAPTVPESVTPQSTATPTVPASATYSPSTAPAEEPVSDETVLSPHAPASPEDDNAAQKPWQGQ